jgi:hypothetical protein
MVIAKSFRNVTLALAGASFLIFVAYDNIFVVIFDAYCRKQGTSEETIPLKWVLILFALNLRSIYVMQFRLSRAVAVIFSVLTIFWQLYAFFLLFVFGIDRFGECFTSMGSHSDQTAPRDGQIMAFIISFCAYALCVLGEILILLISFVFSICRRT